MAGSDVSKRMLADALRALLRDHWFSEVTVTQICSLCGMSRKNFYYHFKDKYDLVNWIFCSEFIDRARAHRGAKEWRLMQALCEYLDANRAFYRRVFAAEGQNCFTEYFSEFVASVISEEVKKMFADQNEEDMAFYIGFYTDAFVMSIRKWILKQEDISSQRLIHLLRTGLIHTPLAVLQRLPRENEQQEENV